MRLRFLLASLLITTAAAELNAQAVGGAARVYGTSDVDIPTPVHSTKAASDASAIQVLIDFIAATKVTGWTGMTEAGSITLAGQVGETDSATLTTLGTSNSRFDVQRSSGVDSTILNGSMGVFISASGKRSSVSSEIATLGLIALPRLFSNGYPTATTVLTDQGVISIGGKALHRVTLDDPSISSTGSPWDTIDLYFDPTTHELCESVAFVHLSTSDASLYTIETSYEDYQPAGTFTLPYRYTQSLNGNLQWTLQLSSISFATPPLSIFIF